MCVDVPRARDYLLSILLSALLLFIHIVFFVLHIEENRGDNPSFIEIRGDSPENVCRSDVRDSFELIENAEPNNRKKKNKKQTS